jgi:hypothetical protein
VLNKIDLLPEGERPHLGGALPTVAISAREPATLQPLLEATEAALWRDGLIHREEPVAEAPANVGVSS